MRVKILLVTIVLAMLITACGDSFPAPNFPVSPTAPEPAITSSGSDFPFQLQPDSPSYLPAFTQPQAGCAWVGIAGQVFDEQGQPLTGINLFIKGELNGRPIEIITKSGSNQAYGPAGFEVQISDRSAETQNAVSVQLFNDQGLALSPAFPISTYDDCQRNLILVNTQASSSSWRASLP